MNKTKDSRPVKSDEEIISAVAFEYEAAEEEVAESVREVLGQMVSQGFLIEEKE